MTPLEGFWWLPGQTRMDLSDKSRLHWMSVLRVPDFVTEEEFHWALETAQKKKKQNLTSVAFLTLTEGLCVQCMHIGPYDTEASTLASIEAFAGEQGFVPDFTSDRLHHEIYLGDPRRTAPQRLRTILRIPVRRQNP